MGNARRDSAYGRAAGIACFVATSFTDSACARSVWKENSLDSAFVRNVIITELLLQKDLMQVSFVL